MAPTMSAAGEGGGASEGRELRMFSFAIYVRRARTARHGYIRPVALVPVAQ